MLFFLHYCEYFYLSPFPQQYGEIGEIRKGKCASQSNIGTMAKTQFSDKSSRSQPVVSNFDFLCTVYSPAHSFEAVGLFHFRVSKYSSLEYFPPLINCRTLSLPKEYLSQTLHILMFSNCKIEPFLSKIIQQS